MLSALLLAALFLLPGLSVLAIAAGNGAAPWPWPTALTLGAALGTAIAAVMAIALGAFSVYSLGVECAALSLLTVGVLGLGRFRIASPFGRASVIETAGSLAVGALACFTFLGHPFEMLLGERDATVYTVSGIGLARQGSLVLEDRTAERIGTDAMRRFYPLRAGQHDSWPRVAQFVKYPGFYYVDADRRQIIAQGLPLLPALIAIFYGTFGLAGAFAANNFVGVLAVLSVLAAGTSLVGEFGAALGAAILALDLVEVWAARYPVAEILFQMLLFSGLAAFLRRDRLGDGLAGFLLGATLFAKIEAGLLLVPIGAYAAVAMVRGRRVPRSAFWVPFAATVLAGALYWTGFQADYVYWAFQFFWSFESRLARSLFVSPGAWMVAAISGGGLLLGIVLALRSGIDRSLVPLAAKSAAVGVVLFTLYGYWLRPHQVGLIAAQPKTLVWLGWYVSPGVLFLGLGGLAHHLWARSRAETLFVLGILLTLAVVFLNFTFVNLLHPYMTRRFVPAVLPLVCLFFGYAVVVLGCSGRGRTRIAAMALAVIVFAVAVRTVVMRSRHLYGHSEYPGLARQFTDLAQSLANQDLVFLSDRAVRNLLGPALEFVYGLRTLVVWPAAYQSEGDLIRKWIDADMALGALTFDTQLETRPGGQEFDLVAHPEFHFRALDQTEDRFPNKFSEDFMTFSRYAAGPGSNALYAFWKREGGRVSESVCGAQVRLLGGDPFLVRHVRARCTDPESRRQSLGYLVGEAEAPVWERALTLYGARFVRHDLAGVVLFDEVAPRVTAGMKRLSPVGWSIEASDGKGSEWLALDGKLETRWGSRAPQRPGMAFTIQFPQPTDLGWVKIRMGRLATDRARRLAFETSEDGSQWKREELPTVLDGIFWEDETPVENGDGNLDLWVGERGVRFLRLVNLGESSHLDWSIAELEVDGAPSADR
jgi:hypothetical protein